MTAPQGQGTLDLSLPGLTINSTPTDYRLNKQLQMMRFKGEQWVLFGDIISGELQD